jgi:hypothetical protein
MIRSGYSADEAADAYNRNTAALEEQLHKAHYTQTEIDQLIGKYKGVPTQVDTAIHANGLESAIDRLGYLLAKLYGLDGSNFGFFIHGYTEIDPISSHHDSVPGRASGGPVAAGGTYLVGERGIEVLHMGSVPGYVQPNVGMRSPLGGMGGGTVEVRLSLAGGDSQLARAVMGSLRAEIQGAYRGNVTLALAGY